MFENEVVDHVAFALKNVEEAFFFTDKANFTHLPSQGVELIFIERQDCSIELLLPVSNQSLKRFIETRKTPAFHHICYRTENLFEFMSTYKLDWIYDVPQPGYKNKLIQFFKQGSVLFEVCETLEPKLKGRKIVVTATQFPKKDLRGFVHVFPSWQPNQKSDLVVPFTEWGFQKEQIRDFLNYFQPVELDVDI
ncbi:MAG: hypothetical protein N2654_01995 [Deltaproteobacteria bacterium]|nr:hypothetical protein [Deltaproteobacteria bacterium]